VHRVVPDEEVAEQTATLAAQLADGPTAAFRAVKELIAVNAGAELADVLDREAAAQERLGASADHSAAVEAFLAKQRPIFLGH
jgi:2-(1,2-epoxy-1,2-dihydrophenyl)acetyl-CoA isomerase